MAFGYRCSLAVLLLALTVACAATDFDFFYLVQQWPGSYCDTAAGCCFPGNEKPAADFGIHGLWPNYAACRPDAADPNKTRCWPDFCNATDTLNPSLIADLECKLRRSWGSLSCRSKNDTEFWSHEWGRHGTCSGMGQHAYFRAALDLTGALLDAGIVPSDEAWYCLRGVVDALAAAAAWLHRHGQVPAVLAAMLSRVSAEGNNSRVGFELSFWKVVSEIALNMHLHLNEIIQKALHCFVRQRIR